MKKYILTLVLALFAFATQAQSGKNFLDQSYIEVTGVAFKEVTPDEIYLNVRIDEKDNKGKESLEQLERKMLKKLESLGINLDEQVALNDLASNFQFYFLKRTDVFATKAYTVKVSTGKKAGEVIGELAELGISNVTLDRVEYSDEETLKMEVKALAVKNAKTKAAALAGALDQQVGKAIHIQEFDSPRMYRADAMEIKVRGVGGLNKQEAPEIAFDKIRVDATVQVKFLMD